MRVTCGTIGEFLTNIQAEGASRVFDKTVRVSRVEDVLDECKSKIRFMVSAVINVGEDGQYLLEAGEYCGVDYKDGELDLKGSEQASRLRTAVMDFCEGKGLRVLPGVVDM